MSEYIQLEQTDIKPGRSCVVCGNLIVLKHLTDNRTICEFCCQALFDLKNNNKRYWVADSKGGEPNHYKDGK